jgi:HEAT repeat protein
MLRAQLGFLLMGLLVLVGGSSALTPSGVIGPPMPPTQDEMEVQDAYIQPTGEGLLELFRKRVPGQVDRAQLAKLVEKLGDPSPEVRVKAHRELVCLGSPAVPLLRRASKELDDVAFAARARQCLDQIQGTSVLTSAARLLAELKPTGTTEVLLAYLPFADDEAVIEEITGTLNEVALQGDKVDPALERALDDKSPTRRAFAAEVLCRKMGASSIPTVRKLLKDPKATVRMRAAIALANVRDAEAIPVLVDLLAELPGERCKPVEDYLSQLAGDWSIGVPAGNDEVARGLRRKLWAEWWKNMEGPGLLAQFGKYTVGDEDRTKILALAAKLDDANAEVRDKAMTELQSLDSAATIPVVRQVANASEGKKAERLTKCLKLLDKGKCAPLPPAAARLLALRAPKGATEALLAFLPSAEDEPMASEVQTALVAVAFPEGKPHPALLRALEDKVGARRVAAVEALCHGGVVREREAVHKLLADKDLDVRRRVAFALAGANDKAAVPVLIALIDTVPLDQGLAVDEYLRQFAGDDAPKDVLDSKPETRKKCREAWAAWWTKVGEKIDLARVERVPRMLGYTMLLEQWSNFGNGRVMEVDKDGKTRWQITGLMYPMDARVIGNDRVLIAEYSSSAVTERNFKGDVLWQKAVTYPTGCQRLRNGNTFIVTRNQLMEVDKSGKEVFTHTPKMGGEIAAAEKLRNGQIAMLMTTGSLVRLDSRGKELKTQRVSPLYYYGSNFQLLPNNRVLMPLPQSGKIVEHDASGKIAWEAPVTGPTSVQRLHNGNTLVACGNGSRVIELNRSGKIVWEYKGGDVRASMARRR